MVRRFLRNLYQGPLAPQLRRFVAVGAFAAVVQMVLLWILVDITKLDYLLGAFIAIEVTIILSYILNNAWTFQTTQHTEAKAYFIGLVKTNIVRGTAVPIQLTILFVLVELRIITYLGANAVAIGVTGIYRYVLDARWTWG
jgi:putative flippase GtrA